MAKWIIDRTINLDYRKTVRVLQLLLEEPRKDDASIEKQLMEEKVLKMGSEGALRRRWFTYLRNYGLVHENDVTEMGVKYAKGKFSLHELALLQMVKRRIRIPSGVYVSPLKVVVLTLKKLIEMRDVDAGFLTQAEFSNFVVDIESDSIENISRLAMLIDNNRTANRTLEIATGEHTDIWFNNFKQLGLFEVLGKSIFVDADNLDLFNFICSIYENDTSTDNICRFNDKFVSSIRTIQLTKEIDSSKVDVSVAGVLYDYVFSGLNRIKLAEKHIRGNTSLVAQTLDKFGISDEQNKGLYMIFQNYPRIVIQKLKSEQSTNLRKIADILEFYVDKVLPIEVEDEVDNLEILNHNFYGMHITRKNSAVTNGEISIGWSALGDLSEVDTKEKLSELVDITFPDKKPRSKAQDISQIWTFINGMTIGDYVVFSDGINAHIGVIKSDYYYEVDGEARDVDYVNNRKVEWLKTVARDVLPKVFRSALSATRSVFSLNTYKSIILELLDKDVLDYDEEEIDGTEDEVMVEELPFIKLNFTTNIDLDFERNRIVFGAPGTGKSFQLEEDRAIIIEKGGDYERVTFHLEYTYSSFVGCYKPVSDKNGKIEYKYIPGPFMRVLVKALRSGLTNDPKPYLLVIEEINRAKVAAVFGEVFQLLDRDSNGTSDYEINASEDVKKYLSEQLGGSLDSFDKLRIPNNMFIWASMNSADQGVFPMDTAFKRRWSFEYKGIDENEDKVGGNVVLGTGEYEFEVNWNTLRKAINYVLAHTYHINEDKLMGPFFVNEDVFAFGEDGMMKNPAKFKKVFKSKVIMYLYEDAAKQQKHKLFSGCDSTKYSSICDAFDKIGIDIFGADFKETYNSMR